jgi:hypothetical protein
MLMGAVRVYEIDAAVLAFRSKGDEAPIRRNRRIQVGGRVGGKPARGLALRGIDPDILISAFGAIG